MNCDWVYRIQAVVFGMSVDGDYVSGHKEIFSGNGSVVAVVASNSKYYRHTVKSVGSVR